MLHCLFDSGEAGEEEQAAAEARKHCHNVFEEMRPKSQRDLSACVALSVSLSLS